MRPLRAGVRLARSKSALTEACDTLVRAMERATDSERETLQARIELGGSGRANVATGLPVLDHLLGLVASHAGFDLQLEVAPGGPDAVASAAGRSPSGPNWSDAIVGFAIVPSVGSTDAVSVHLPWPRRSP